jgi:hypothetical protein
MSWIKRNSRNSFLRFPKKIKFMSESIETQYMLEKLMLRARDMEKAS